MGKKKKRIKSLREESSSRPENDPGRKPSGQKKVKRKESLRRREHPNWPLTALAVAGMVLTAYLVLTSWLGTPPLYCDEGSSCDIVQQSRWGTFLGLPVSLFGFLTYAVLGHIGYRVRDPEKHWKWSWAVALVGLGYSVYLNVISLFVIQATCIYCLTSLTIMAAIFGVVFFQRPAGLRNFKFTTWAGETLVVTALIIGGMHLYYSGVFDPAMGPEDPYLKGLAEHLKEENAVMYGAYW